MLLIAKRSGFSVVVSLYSLSQPPGAFSVGWPGNQAYYRGGDSEALKNTLQAAYEASRKQ
jgi:hypothetical protein